MHFTFQLSITKPWHTPSRISPPTPRPQLIRRRRCPRPDWKLRWVEGYRHPGSGCQTAGVETSDFASALRAGPSLMRRRGAVAGGRWEPSGFQNHLGARCRLEPRRPRPSSVSRRPCRSSRGSPGGAPSPGLGVRGGRAPTSWHYRDAKAKECQGAVTSGKGLDLSSAGYLSPRSPCL